MGVQRWKFNQKLLKSQKKGPKITFLTKKSLKIVSGNKNPLKSPNKIDTFFDINPQTFGGFYKFYVLFLKMHVFYGGDGSKLSSEIDLFSSKNQGFYPPPGFVTFEGSFLPEKRQKP